MKCGHLFNGIGGFALAAHWMGWDNVWHSEIDDFCNQVMHKHFPESQQYGDIKETDWSKAEAIDLITGGFPCQPFSEAGKRGGTADDRYLWPEMFEVIKCKSPAWIVAENVDGLVSWNEGMVLDTVLSDLESKGYEVQTYILPASGVNAPHRRYRVWIVAYSNHTRAGEPLRINGNGAQKNEGRGRQPQFKLRKNGINGSSANTNSKGLQGGKVNGSSGEIGKERNKQLAGCFSSTWEKFPTQSPVCRGNDGLPFELDIIRGVENDTKKESKNTEEDSTISRFRWKVLRRMWELRELAETSPHLYRKRLCDSLPEVPQGRTYEGWLVGAWAYQNEELRDLWERIYTQSYQESQDLQQRMFERIREKERYEKMVKGQRVNRIKALGNAIVPQVAYQIFKAIEQHKLTD